MKASLLILQFIAVLASHSAVAWKSNTPNEKTYTFKYQLKTEIIRLSIEAQSYEDAFEKAASQCARHFQGQSKLNEETKMDIIDTCANPRS